MYFISGIEISEDYDASDVIDLILEENTENNCIAQYFLNVLIKNKEGKR